MLTVPVVNMQGESRGTVEVDPEVFGGEVRPALIKQAVVAYQDRQRQYSARTRSRGMVVGSSQKLYRQKGTGNARMGTIRTNIRRGGGVAFAKLPGRRVKRLPKKMKRLARDSAILAKIRGESVVIVEDLGVEAPRTRTIAGMLRALGADRGCVMALGEPDRNVYLSSRNIPKTEVRLASELNAYDILRRKKLILTRSAWDRMVSGSAE